MERAVNLDHTQGVFRGVRKGKTSDNQGGVPWPDWRCSCSLWPPW